MKINIFGSTGEIGSKSLRVISKYFPDIRINFLSANSNYKKLINQTLFYKPKYIFIKDTSKIPFILKRISKIKTKLLSSGELNDYLINNTSDYTILAISGIDALNYFKNILINTKYLGLVNKECIVSAGHLFSNLIKNKKVKIYPLDSEHYSLNNFFTFNKKNNIKKIFLTATGGPFLEKNFKLLKNVTFNEAINHPKWKMGYKNSIDSATLANKCLEIVEAHYLFNIPYEKLNILIHPQALVHSVIEYSDMTSVMNAFFPDMFIPIFNFFNHNNTIKESNYLNKYKLNDNFDLSFMKVDAKKYPIYRVFQSINKNSPLEIIKFNCANEVAIEKFRYGEIYFNEIDKFIHKSLNLDFSYPVNTVNKVIEFQNNYRLKICN